MLRHPSLITLGILCGCFRGFDAVGAASRPAPSLSLEVGDANLGLWEALQVPRAPVLTLRANQPLTRDAERHLFLLRGTPTEETLLDLESNSVRESTAQQLVALQITRVGVGNGIEARPGAALVPGADYSLIWAAAQASQTFPLRVSLSPAAGARLVQSMPAALDSRVPPNLSRALLRFDGYIDGDLDAVLTLRDAQGSLLPQRARVLACEQLGLPPGDCVEVTPEAPLDALGRYTLQLGAGLEDATGAPLPEHEIAFRTAAAEDGVAPQWMETECARDETRLERGVCLLAGAGEVALRARSNENGLLTLSCAGQTRSSLGSSGEYGLTLPLEAAASCVLALRDLAGNHSSSLLALAPAPDLPRIAIVEVRADPLGPEPAQEYVELLNFGDDARSIEGFTLTTDPFAIGAAIQADVVLAPGERVLVVAADFDAAETSDSALPQGVRLARLERALSLRNDGAALFLRDVQGRRVSAAPALAARPGQCIVRSGESLRQGSALDFRPDASGGCTPGFGSDPP